MSVPEPPPSFRPTNAAYALKQPSEQTPVVTPDAILAAEEAVRARVFYRVLLVLAVMVGMFVPLLPGEVWLRGLAGGLCGLEVGLAIFVLRSLSAEGRYTPRLAFVAAMVTCVIGIA